MTEKWHNQKEIPIPKTALGKNTYPKFNQKSKVTVSLTGKDEIIHNQSLLQIIPKSNII